MKRSAELLTLKLNRSSSIALHLQIYRALRQAISSGKVAPGSAVPATRSLAKTLRVSRNTILNAYEALTAEGVLVGIPGACTRVRGSLDVATAVAISTPFDPALIFRAAHFPMEVAGFCDPEGNPVYSYRASINHVTQRIRRR